MDRPERVSRGDATRTRKRIYDYLVEHTNWDLTLDSDNADAIIASRIMSHTT